MRSNTPVSTPPPLTHEGAQAVRISALQTLRRMSLAALLFEDQHYQSGDKHAEDVAELVKTLVDNGQAGEVAALAIECRDRMYLRHMPLFLVAQLTQHKGCGTLVADALTHVVQRADELGEFLAIYARLSPTALRKQIGWRTNAPTGTVQGIKLSAGAKRGLAAAIRKFSAYDLAKYDRDGAFKLRDVIRLVHPVPQDKEQSEVWKKLLAGQLEPPDTWEVALSAGADKKLTFERLIREKKLGGLAFLRNLRNMLQVKVDRDLIKQRFEEPNGFKRVLPFRFLVAATHAPDLEPEIERAMIQAAGQLPKLSGHTILVVDTSGSMNTALSAKSELTRTGAAAALAILAREQCERVTIICTAGNDGTRVHATMKLPPRRGMALRDLIIKAPDTIGGGGIFLVQAMNWIAENVDEPADRVVVFTDEQDCDTKLKPDTAKRLGVLGNYLVNVGSYRHGIAYKPWVHIDGFSERTLDFVREESDSLQR